MAKVVAGTGEVDGAWVERIDTVVRAELPTLLPLFRDKPKHAFFVHVHADRASLPDSLAGFLHAESPAFALLGQHQIHLVVGEIQRLAVDVHGVVRHELVHELLDQFAAPHGRGVPRWVHEGLAQYVAGDTYLRAREDDLAWRLMARRLRAFGELRTSFPTDVDDLRSAYAQSYSYVSWLVREYGFDELLAVVRAVDDHTAFEAALAGRLGRPTVALEEAWRHYVLHGSGAPWRVLLDQCFSLSLLAILPLLVLALRRRLAREGRVARALAIAETQAAAAPPTGPEPAAAPEAEPQPPPVPDDDDFADEPIPGTDDGSPRPSVREAPHAAADDGRPDGGPADNPR